MKKISLTACILIALISTEAQSLTYDNTTLGGLRSGLTASISELSSASLCYNSSTSYAKIIDGNASLILLESWGKNFSSSAPMEQAFLTLEEPNSMAVYIYVIDEDGQGIKYLFVPYGDDYELSGHLIRLNPISDDDPDPDPEPTPLDPDCVTCVSSSGFNAAKGESCSCADASYDACGTPCHGRTYCQPCHISEPNPQQEIALDVCDGIIPSSNFYDQTPLTTLPYGYVL
jgi:hypothetical protein